MAAKTITAFRIQTRLEADAKQHHAEYQKAERDVSHYTDELKKKGKEAARAFDGAGAGAKFGKDFSASAVSMIGSEFNVSTLGSIIGTAIAPGIGTAIGSAIGGGIDKAVSTIAPIVLQTLERGIDLNKEIERGIAHYTLFAGTEKQALDYMSELKEISVKGMIDARSVIAASERLEEFTDDLKLTDSILKAASAAAPADAERFNTIADVLGLIAEKGDLSSQALKKLYRQRINAPELLAQATGMSEKEIKKLIGEGRLRGDVAARVIAEGIQRQRAGWADQLSQTTFGAEAKYNVLMEQRGAEGTQNATRAVGDFYKKVDTLLGSSQAKDFVAFVNNISGQVIDWTEKGIKTGVSIGAGFAQGLMDGGSLSNILGSFTKLKDWTGNALSAVFEIKSPSQWSAREVGEPLGEGIGVGLVRRFQGFMQGEGADSIKQTLESLLNDPKIAALLQTIATAEGGGIDVMAGGRRVQSGARHPGELVPKSQWFKGNRGRSSASGLYQETLTNWRKAEAVLGPLNFSDPRDQQMVALWLMTSHAGGTSALRGGNISSMMGLAAKDWTSTPGSTIGGGGQWGRGRWQQTYQSFLGGGAGAGYGQGSLGTKTNPASVTIVRDLIGGSSAQMDTASEFNRLFVQPFQDAGTAVVNITDSARDLVSTTTDLANITGIIPVKMNPSIVAQYEAANAADRQAHATMTLKQIEEEMGQTLIIAADRVGQFSGMLGQITGMVPSQQVGKKRGLFSKILGFAAPFLSFLPGGGIISTLVGAAGNIAGGNYGAAISGVAGGLQPGGVFRSGGSHTSTTSPAHPGYGHSHAMGLRYVPYDNYVANLHRGERVLTAKENQDGGGGLHPAHAALLDRVARALETLETASPHDVVTRGYRGLSTALGRDSGEVERLGRRLNFAR